MTGKVYLVGAGPGDPGLITVRGLACIRRADAIVYDRLVAPELLAEARPDAQLYYVGKGEGWETVSQDDINRMLESLAVRGLEVCRLKGGDPFVFGRGGEEAEYLATRSIPFEVVPGVSAAIAAPAAAGIPVTHRAQATSVVIATGHTCSGSAGPAWEAAAGLDTIVLLMGMKNLPAISQRLMAAGRSPATPAAVVRRGTWPDQQVVTGTLADIAERARAAGLGPPATVVIGEVVRLRDRLVNAKGAHAPGAVGR
ncbi:uroporphyrinogen-III C-methyltransferase [Caldinitratiruptor microaerophilus]|uniref:uroporphyrinogen-III C-methyltransferase n=1 Tax=Caldinitratiruptor microaerophilus TaxID=671077 RepID=A0AA35CNB4_9FIRM|nr:uroporphyrinogen-III C-methyltransferase [Caldinitratiruptor microaerophilus]BDG61553.1 hypothetical protein caldi_26430 [Caldinitratiruptor microaerophilus]